MFKLPPEKEALLRQYLKCVLTRRLPSTSFDATRMAIIFFAMAALDILDQLEHHFDSDARSRLIEWIYSQQITGRPSKKGSLGFRGSPANSSGHEHDFSNMGATYAAIATLVLLGDDLSRVDIESMRNLKRDLQGEDGRVFGSYDNEGDMRFVYCSCVVAYLLDDWSIIDVEKTTNYIKACYTYEDAFGQVPGCEAHAGSTYCAVASLKLMGKLDSVLSEQDIKKLTRWLLFKQTDGFSGRPNKDSDTCYSFWVGGALKLLGYHHLINHEQNITFITLSANPKSGGIAKYPFESADPLHTFLALSALSLDKMDARVNITKRSLSRFRNGKFYDCGDSHAPVKSDRSVSS